MIDSIIFDLDGTMWDATAALVQPWNEVFEEEGIKKRVTLEDMQSVMGLVIKDIANRFVPELSDAEQDRIMAKCCERESVYLNRTGGNLYDGLEETLKELSKNYRLFIVSNCENGYIDAFYNAHGLDKYFTDVEFSGRTGKSKGENIKILMERCNLKSPVYVGDTQKDKEACVYAEIPFLFASYGFGTVEQADGVLTSVRDLPNAVATLEKERSHNVR